MRYNLELCFLRLKPHGGSFDGEIFAKMTFYVGANLRGDYSEVRAYSKIYGTELPVT